MRIRFYGLPLLVLGLLPLQAGATPLNLVLRQKVDLSLGNSGTSDQLFALAKVGNINIVADATDFAQFPHTATVTEKSDLIAAVSRVANEQKLGWRSDNPRTLLFWSAPDVLTLATDLLHDEELNRLLAVEPLPAFKSEKPSQDQQRNHSALMLLWMQEHDRQEQAAGFPSARLVAHLAEYLHANYGWNGQDANLSVSFKLSQLPPELQSQLKPLIVHHIRSTSIDACGPWFAPNLWNTATVCIKPLPIINKQVLAVISTLDGQVVQRQTDVEPRKRRTAQEQAQAEARNEARAQAQAEAQALLPVKAPSVEDVTPTGLAPDAHFLAPVSLQLKEQPLTQVLAEVQKQSGLNLSLSPDAKPALGAKSVTLSVQGMPLGELMQSVAHLYGAQWKSENDGYTLSDGHLSPARQELLRAGDLQWYRFWQHPLLQPKAPARFTLEELPNWKDEFTRLGLFDALSSPQGVAFADLPADTQLKLRTIMLRNLSSYLIHDYSEAASLEHDLTIRTGLTTQASVNGKPLPRSLQLSVLADDGTSLDDIVLDAQKVETGERFFQQDQAKANGANNGEGATDAQ